MYTELYDGNKNNNDIEKLDKNQQKHQELYEKNLQKELHHQQQQQQQQQQQELQQNQQIPHHQHQLQHPQPQPDQPQLQQNGGFTSPPQDTSSETIDVTTVPVSTTESNLNICLTNKISPNNNTGTSDVTNQVYNRDIHPPNSIYGIENLTSKPYEVEQKTSIPESIHSPRYQNNPHISSSPHHSSPERERRLQRPEANAPWVSPIKAHNYRNPCPPTSPYIDARDPIYPPRDPSYVPRRYVPPLYGNGTRNFVHPSDRSRYGTYPMGSPLMSTLGYPRDALDARYNLHMPNIGLEEEKFKLSPPSIDDKHIWTKQEVELLLDLYEEHKIKLQDPRVRKTKVWEDIAKQIHDKLDADVNGCQCNQKFRNMKADYQKVVEHNARSGSFRKTCKYFDRLEKLLTPVNETEKTKEEVENDTKYFNHPSFTNGHHSFATKAETPNGNAFYERENSRSSSSPDSGNQNYGNSTGSTNTPSSPEKRPLNHIETGSDEASPPPAKIPCNECNCGSINKKELLDVLKEYLKEQRKREEETINRIQTLHKEKIETVVKFLDLFQELVKKV